MTLTYQGLFGGRSLRLQCFVSRVVRLLADMENLLWKAEVDRIERNDEILIVIYLLECADNTWLAADSPGEVFVRNRVLQTHPFLVDGRQLVFMDCGWIVALEAKAADMVSALQHGV